MFGRHSIVSMAEWDIVFSLEQSIKLVFHSSTHLLPFACYYFPIDAFEGFVMLWAGPCVFLMFPYTLDVWMFCWTLDIFAEPISVNQGSMLNLVPESPGNLQVSLPGWLLVLGTYVALLCGRVSWVDIATNQSSPRWGVGSQGFPKIRRASHFVNTPQLYMRRHGVITDSYCSVEFGQPHQFGCYHATFFYTITGCLATETFRLLTTKGLNY